MQLVTVKGINNQNRFETVLLLLCIYIIIYEKKIKKKEKEKVNCLLI